MKQQSLALRTWGGRRRGAGRKPAGQYVLDNHRNHMRRSGVPVAEGDSPDPFSSQAARTPRGGQLELWGNGATRDARGWLLRKAIAQ